MGGSECEGRGLEEELGRRVYDEDVVSTQHCCVAFSCDQILLGFVILAILF